MLFDDITQAPADAILGLTEAFRADPNPKKVNLTVGVYQNEAGRTPIMRCVKQAEAMLLDQETSKAYLPMSGAPDYAAAVRRLMFGPRHEVVASARCATLQAPGGTGALRTAAEFLKHNLPSPTVWVSEPSWPNHPGIFQAAGLEVKTYPYFDPATNGLRAEEMFAALRQVPRGDVVVLHGCCHNPTGIDPGAEQWETISQIVGERGFLPLLDFAYQGLGDGLSEDAAGLHALAKTGRELLVCNSFSKNFGLYSERVGALSAVCESADAAQRVMSQIKLCVRTNYSNPPSHGARIVSTVLGSDALRATWEQEVAEIRERMHDMRRLLVETLAREGAGRDFDFITQQKGMFSFSGLTPEQVDRLREEHSIYIVRSGRINVAGLNRDNITGVCQAIAGVL